MRKTTKALLAIGAILATPSVINYVISKKAKVRIAQKKKEGVFGWEYGDIHYIKAGSGKPLLLIHGIYPGAATHEWENTIEHFSKNHTVYALDLLGFGYSAKPMLDYSSYLYVRLIKDFAEAVIGKPTYAAASLHSAAALVTCAALNPDDFTKILLISPTGLETNTDFAQEDDGVTKKILQSPIFGTTVYNMLCCKKAIPEFYAAESLAKQIDEKTLDEIYLSAHAEGANGKYAIAALLGKFFNVDIKQSLDELTIPYQIILGKDTNNIETITTPTGSFKIWSGMDVSYSGTVIENSGVLPHVDNPQEFLDACKF